MDFEEVTTNFASEPGSVRTQGPTTARLPCTHLGSIGLSQGLFVGKKQGRMRTPLPWAFTWALCWRIQVRTSLLTCQEALSQMSNQAVLPWACSWSQPHCKT